MYQVKNVQNTRNNELRWFATGINFKLLHTGCPIAHDESYLLSDYANRLFSCSTKGSGSSYILPNKAILKKNLNRTIFHYIL